MLNSINLQSNNNQFSFTGKLDRLAQVKKLVPGDRVTLGAWRTQFNEATSKHFDGIRLDRGRVEKIEIKPLSMPKGFKAKTLVWCKISQLIREGQKLSGKLGCKVGLFFDKNGNRFGREFIVGTKGLERTLKNR